MREVIANFLLRADSHASRGLFVTVDPASGQRLGSASDPAAAAKMLARRAPDAPTSAVARLLSALHRLKGPALIDLAVAARLLVPGVMPRDALMRSRVRFHGTDGIRGKIGADAPGREAELFFREGVVTPRLLAAISAAFIRLAARKAPPGAKVAVADDGRDLLTGGRFRAAVFAAIQREGRVPVDLGICPTPLVPVYCAMNKVRAAVVLTASHNPADQNGIKLFLDGRKLLPEGAVSDYAMSALAFEALAADKEAARGRRRRLEKGRHVRGLAVAVARAALAGAMEFLQSRGIRFIVDTAHGAYSACADAVFKALGLPAEIVNSDTTGENINHDCGIAVIEGTEKYTAGDAMTPEIARRLSEAGRIGDGNVLGIALDGDGDRGFLLVPDRSGDVHVLDGDRLAYLIARYLVQKRHKRGRFVGTVESDLAVFAAVEKDLGLPTRMVCVGDKYLSSTPEAKKDLLIGEEASGHVVLPVRLAAGRTVITGNGLLTALLGAEALCSIGEPVEHVRPYVPGLMKTYYTYYVDKTRLYEGSDVWIKDTEAARKACKRAVAMGDLPAATTMTETKFADAPDMLYLTLRNAGERIGAVFTRASGTEDKVAAYARGDAAYAKGILAITDAIVQNHAAMLKDKRKVETRAEAAILKVTREKARLTPEFAADILRKAHIDMTPPAIRSLLVAMAKGNLLT